MPATVQLFLSDSPRNMQPRRLTQWCVFMRKIEAGNTLPLRSFRHRRNGGFLATRRGVSYRSVPVPQHPPEATQRLSLSADTARENDSDTGRLHLKARQQAQAGCLLAQLIAQLHACNQEAEQSRNLETTLDPQDLAEICTDPSSGKPEGAGPGAPFTKPSNPSFAQCVMLKRSKATIMQTLHSHRSHGPEVPIFALARGNVSARLLRTLITAWPNTAADTSYSRPRRTNHAQQAVAWQRTQRGGTSTGKLSQGHCRWLRGSCRRSAGVELCG